MWIRGHAFILGLLPTAWFQNSVLNRNVQSPIVLGDEIELEDQALLIYVGV